MQCGSSEESRFCFKCFGLRIEGRFILLLADNAPGHKEVELTNIHVEYMPTNATSLIQPADAGIIKCFKGFTVRCK